MNIVIHKGTNEIGGSCIEVKSDSTTLLIDFGAPLDENSQKVDMSNTKIDAVIISHPHQDHFGEILNIDTSIPIYCGKLSLELMNATKLFTGGEILKNNFTTFEAWKSFYAGDIKITPFLVDHSAVDAYAFLIENDNKKIVYSGDFRANGRKSKLFANMLDDKRLKNADVLLMEGTMLKRSNEDFPDEQSVEDKIFETIKETKNLTFMIGSSQNIDSIVSLYRACKKAKKTFVVDIYTAWILEKMKSVSSTIPNISWSDVGVLTDFGGSHYEKLKSNSQYFGDFTTRVFQNKISLENIADNPFGFVIKMPPSTIERLLNKMSLANANVIYSQWLGYLEPKYSNEKMVELFAKLKSNYNWVYAHTSGHADLESLKLFASSLNPKQLIPIHTEYKNKFVEHFDNVAVLEDGEKYNLKEIEKMDKSYDLKYFELAKDLNEKYRERLGKKQLHCRGSLNSMSLISLAKETPERGFSSIKDENKLQAILEKIENGKEVICPPERPTPEKLLQATIINEAMKDSNHLLPFGNKIKFITSEFAMKVDGKKIVNDILGFSEAGELYIIELKSSRFKAELEKQVNEFEEFVNSHSNLFTDLLKIYGYKWDGKTIIKAVVWPMLESGSQKMFSDNIEEYVYKKYNLENDNELFIQELSSTN